MPATLREVAKEAGVSISTASRALANSSIIRRSTALRVQKAAQVLGYRPNTLARGLKNQKSNLVGLIIHNLVNVTFHTIVEVVQRRLGAAGYQVILGITHDDEAQEAHYLQMLGDHRVDGVIAVGTGQNSELLTSLRLSGISIVTLIRQVPGVPADSVLATDEAGALEATRYLLSLGHRRIGLIVGRDTTTSGRERRRGYIRALAEAGIGFDEKLVVHGPYDPATGTSGARRLLELEPRPTALFVANHESVFGVLPVIVELGLQVPRDLSLLCYEDVPWFKWWHPAITVVDNGAVSIADLAVDLILKSMADKHSPAQVAPREYRVGAQLIIRHSCAAPE